MLGPLNVKLGVKTVYHDLYYSWFSSVPRGKYRFRIVN